MLLFRYSSFSETKFWHKNKCVTLELCQDFFSLVSSFLLISTCNLVKWNIHWNVKTIFLLLLLYNYILEFLQKCCLWRPSIKKTTKKNVWRKLGKVEKGKCFFLFANNTFRERQEKKQGGSPLLLYLLFSISDPLLWLAIYLIHNWSANVIYISITNLSAKFRLWYNLSDWF